jgi:hypothetical protein
MGDLLVFVDESGDHNLKGGGDPNYPLFVLVAVLIDGDEYVKIDQKFEQIKLKFFGNKSIVFHEREIRKAEGDFRILQNPDTRSEFLQDLNRTIEDSKFKIIASVIDKRSLLKKYPYQPKNPYDISLQFILERIGFEVQSRRSASEVPIRAESRGKKEDRELREEFDRICSGNSTLSPNSHLPPQIFSTMRLYFHKKEENIVGIQLADLIARPIGISYLRPNQQNRAYESILRKFRTSSAGKIGGYGLKIFP